MPPVKMTSNAQMIAHERRVRAPHLGEPAGHAGQHPVVPRPVQSIVHQQPPSGSSEKFAALPSTDRSMTGAPTAPSRVQTSPLWASPRSSRLCANVNCSSTRSLRRRVGGDAQLERSGVGRERSGRVAVDQEPGPAGIGRDVELLDARAGGVDATVTGVEVELELGQLGAGEADRATARVRRRPRSTPTWSPGSVTVHAWRRRPNPPGERRPISWSLSSRVGGWPW